MPETPQNAVWEMFSGKKEMVSAGLRDYQPRTPDLKQVLNALIEEHGLEGAAMAYTWKDWH